MVVAGFHSVNCGNTYIRFALFTMLHNIKSVAVIWNDCHTSFFPGIKNYCAVALALELTGLSRSTPASNTPFPLQSCQAVTP